MTLDRMSDSIDFWLFKMPPTFKYTSENIEIVRKFFDKIKLDDNNNNNKDVLEFRDPSWWNVIDKIAEIGIVFVQLMLLDFLVPELLLIMRYTSEYMVMRNGITISIPKQNLTLWYHQLKN